MIDPNTRRKFEALVAAAFVDGYLAEAEREVLEQKAAAMNIPTREMHEILGLGQQRKLSVSIPAGSLERAALLEDLIDVVVADGRVEAPEYHLLARFAETMKIGLPDLRLRVNRRMQAASDRATRVEPRRETVRSAPATRPVPPPRSAPPRSPPPPPAPAVAPPAPPAFASASFSKETPTIASQEPLHSVSSFPKETKVADLPPVTLQLLKQSIMFDTEADSIVYISRTLNVPPSGAEEVRQAILAAFPDLKPGSQQVRPLRR